MFERAKQVIPQSGLGPTKYYGDINDGLRTPFIKLAQNGQASLKPAHESDLEKRAIAARLTSEQRRELTAMLMKCRADAVGADEALRLGVDFIQGCVRENTKKRPKAA